MPSGERVRFGGLVLVFALFAASAARGEDITWVTSAQSMPQFSDTQDSGQLSFLTTHLPRFTHHVVRVSTARAYHELEHGSGVCKVGVLLSPERERYATFAARHLLLPGFRLVVRKDRLPALSAAMSKGEVDLERLVGESALKGGYTRSRHFDAPITDFLQARDASTMENVVATFQLFNLLQAERLDFAFILPMDLYFYTTPEARDKLVLLPIGGVAPVIEAAVACSSDQSGKNAIRDIDALLADDARWAELVEPLRKWMPPESFPQLLAGRPANAPAPP